MQESKITTIVHPLSMSMLLASAALTGLLTAEFASAQTLQDEGASELETVLVTAQRRSERMEDVPITVTNISAEQLRQSGVSSLSEIATLTPALRFDSRTAFVQPTIRGVGTLLTVNGGTSNVGIYIDGFYSPNPLASNFQLLTVESIDVLKGPQGTLFGRNTSGGAILVNTSKPSTDFRGIGEVSYGSYNAQTYQGYVTGGVTDAIAVDIGAIVSKGDGFVENIATGDDKAGKYDNWSVRTGVNFDLSDNVSVLFRYEHQETNDRTSTAGNAFVNNGQPAVYGAFIPGAIVATRPGEVSYDEPVGFEQESDAFQLTASFDLNFATLTSFSQYRREKGLTLYTNDFVSAQLLTVRLPVVDEAITQELLLASRPGDRFQWTAGAFYYDYDDAYPSTDVQLFGAPFTRTSSVASNSRSIAAYADATYALREDLFLTAGARYTRDEIEGNFATPAAGRTDLPAVSGSRVTPRAVIRYEPTTQSSVYASFSRGYKGAVYNTGGFSSVPLKPENLLAYEVGYKYASPDFSVGLSSFYYDYKDQQVSSTVTIDGTPRTVLNNAASSHIYGVEAQASYAITDKFDVNIGAAWTRARFKSFPDSPTLTQCLADTCGASRGLMLAGSVEAGGFHMARSPDYTATAGARYNMPVAGGALVLSGDLYYTSKFYFDTSEQFAQDAYTLLNLRAEWSDSSDRYSVAVYGNNVTDEDYLVQVYTGTYGVGAMWGYPATVGASARIRF